MKNTDYLYQAFLDDQIITEGSRSTWSWKWFFVGVITAVAFGLIVAL